jgi:hypothetical protein
LKNELLDAQFKVDDAAETVVFPHILRLHSSCTIAAEQGYFAPDGGVSPEQALLG